MDSLKTKTEDTYTAFLVFRRPEPIGLHPIKADSNTSAKLKKLFSNLNKKGIILRGIYNLTGMRNNADVMLWIHGNNPSALQRAIKSINEASIFKHLLRTWNAIGVHREAEFNKQHIPGFIRGEEARRWLTVYPFVRSYDWYILPPEERSEMLKEHGNKGSVFRDVVANTVSAFALGDYEWLLPMESNNLVSLVDLMRELRDTKARLHVKEETPFFTGKKIDLDDLIELFS